MDADHEADDLPLSPPAAALAEFLDRQAAGERVDFDAFCAERPAIAADLRRLHAKLMTASRAFVTPAALEPPTTPDAIGAYCIDGILGEGGMGIVYRGNRADGSRVAVKVVRDGLDSERVLARFELERQSLAALDHPNIAAVIEAGMTREGAPFFALEYVDGPPITRFAIDRDLDPAACAALLAEVCDGVHHAHERGILHRDLKPSNILVATDQTGQPTPKIIDFGLARAVDPAAVQRPFRTTRGVVLGTPEYMSPEQAAAGADSVDARSDVHALGVVLYELLARAHPFLDSPHTGPVELLRRIVHLGPAPPSERTKDVARAAAVRQMGFDNVVLRALDKNPQARYATSAEFASILRR